MLITTLNIIAKKKKPNNKNPANVDVHQWKTLKKLLKFSKIF